MNEKRYHPLNWLILYCCTISLVLFCFYQLPCARGQAANDTLKIYRGSIGDNHIEMRLTIEGSKASGTYSYDQFRRDLRLAGTYTPQGQLELAEFAPGGKQTGRFVCKPASERFDVDFECDWSKPNGQGKTYTSLTEQHVAFRQGLRIVPKVIISLKSSTSVSFPQLVGSTANAKATEAFNRRIAQMVGQAIKEFGPEPPPAVTVFETNYNILLGTDEVVSVEMSEYSNSGGAHPNTRLWALTYDLLSNRELSLDDLFKQNADYKQAIRDHCVQDINRQADRIDEDEARRNGQKVVKRAEPVMSSDSLPDIYAFAITPKGLAIYLEFPHVMAVFNKAFVPYSVVRSYLKPDGPAARFVR